MASKFLIILNLHKYRTWSTAVKGISPQPLTWLLRLRGCLTAGSLKCRQGQGLSVQKTWRKRSSSQGKKQVHFKTDFSLLYKYKCFRVPFSQNPGSYILSTGLGTFIKRVSFKVKRRPFSTPHPSYSSFRMETFYSQRAGQERISLGFANKGLLSSSVPSSSGNIFCQILWALKLTHIMLNIIKIYIHYRGQLMWDRI